MRADGAQAPALAGPDRDRGRDFRSSGRRSSICTGRGDCAPDRAFVARLAASHTVYAPKFPGTSRGDHEAVHVLENWLDLVVYHGELFDRLGLAAPSLVGHSFGGLVAAEVAASMPHSVGRLVLIDPVGLGVMTFR